jgi:hypothetical protein
MRPPNSENCPKLSPVAVLVTLSQFLLSATTTAFAAPLLISAKSFPVMSGSGNQLILCILVSLHAFEHVGGNQFHGRVELTGQDCGLLGESADLRGKRVDDFVRVGWNLSQNKSPFNAKPPQSDWIAGVEKIGMLD